MDRFKRSTFKHVEVRDAQAYEFANVVSDESRTKLMHRLHRARTGSGSFMQRMIDKKVLKGNAWGDVIRGGDGVEALARDAVTIGKTACGKTCELGAIAQFPNALQYQEPGIEFSCSAEQCPRTGITEAEQAMARAIESAHDQLQQQYAKLGTTAHD